MSSNPSGTPSIIQAAFFAAEKHKFQRRKADDSPYINHPLGVAHILEETGVHDTNVLIAAILHDTVEDTDTTLEELEKVFGKDIADIVAEVTDDKSLSKGARKRCQIEHVAHISKEGKLIKLADKLYNCRDLLSLPPPSWDAKRVQGYIVWAKAVLAGARGLNAKLDAAHDQLYTTGTFEIDGQEYPAFPCSDSEDEAEFLEAYLTSMDAVM